MDWYPWYPTDFKRDTYRLSLAEDGAYRRLIDEYMTTRAPLPDDDRALARILGCTAEEWASVSLIVRGFFRAREGVLKHKRCDTELAAQNTRKERYSARGKKAAFAKYSNPNWMRASRKLVPATIHNIDKTSTEYGAEKGTSEKAGVASSSLVNAMQQKRWV